MERMISIRITSPGGYTDRYGVFHEVSSVVEFPERLATKLIVNRFAVLAPTVSRPVTTRPSGRKG